MNSRLLKELYETAKGMHKSGIMSDRKFREFTKLCNSKSTENKPPRKIN